MSILLLASLMPFLICMVGASAAVLANPRGPWSHVYGFGLLLIPAAAMVALVACDVCFAMGISIKEATAPKK